MIEKPFLHFLQRFFKLLEDKKVEFRLSDAHPTFSKLLKIVH